MAQLFLGDNLEILRAMADGCVDSIVTDPPYGLRFMGKRWDYDVPSVELWAECLRVLKPGGHLLAFAGTRTQHRMACRIEDAGFEIRDMIAWVYGCLDAATEVATERGVMPYHKTKVGDRVLCYDIENGEYTYQPILEVVEYDYSDTAYRLVGDFGEQVVSRNHRVIVECGGSEAFNLAETLGAEARVPVLENLPALQQAVHDAQQDAGRTKQDVQQGVCKHTDWACEYRDNPIGEPQGQNDQVLGLRGGSLEAGRMAAQGGDTDMQQGVQRGATRCGVGCACSHGAGKLDRRVGSRTEGANDRGVEPVMEGWAYVSEPEGGVCESADKVRSVPGGDASNGPVGRLRHGTSAGGGSGDWANAFSGGMCSPHQPRCDGQPGGEPDAVRHERAAQGVRAWGGHRSDVVRVVPFHYTGKVWCLRVPTGAFVAVRNGVAFPTGNSGFPKSLDVSKAIDKAVGAVRECTRPGKVTRDGYGEDWDTGDSATRPRFDNPATESARQWQGWGTALKPALEPITLARKPLEGTVADNVLAHGTGALHIAACRVATPGTDVGRWPANLAHDGSDDVLLSFPVTGPSKAGVRDPNGSMGYHGGVSGLPGVVSGYADGGGSAARFFYCAKASRKDRDDGLGAFEIHSAGELTGGRAEGSAGLNCPRAGAGRTSGGRNSHPTVKPTDLMRYLSRLVTPPGGVVLDPFMGSGSTGKAAALEGFQFIGIDREREYVEIARARILDAQRLIDESIFNPAKAGFFTPAGGEGGDG